MTDPYNQIKKLDANAASYGKVMTDSQLASGGYELALATVGKMLEGYVSHGLLPASNAAIAYNGSSFYLKGTWNPPSDYYNKRTSSWVSIVDGVVQRKRITEDGDNLPMPNKVIIGITSAGNLKIYGGAGNIWGMAGSPASRQKYYDELIADKTKNTWTFGPVLIRDGKAVSLEKPKESAYRQIICQINSNNYAMLTSSHPMSYETAINKLLGIGCKAAYNLDGGGSTSIFYKKAGSNKATKIGCFDGANRTTCRSMVDGIYFTE